MALKLKLLRIQAGLTLEQLAQRCGLTRSYLSKVERGLSTPSIETALKLANALGVKVDKLFGAPEKKEEISVSRAIERGDQGTDDQLSLVTSADGGRLMRAFVLKPERPGNGRSHKRLLSHHDGEEILYVLEGELELTIGSEKILLNVGDCVQFNSKTPHMLVSVGANDGKALLVLTDFDRMVTHI